MHGAQMHIFKAVRQLSFQEFCKAIRLFNRHGKSAKQRRAFLKVLQDRKLLGDEEGYVMYKFAHNFTVGKDGMIDYKKSWYA